MPRQYQGEPIPNPYQDRQPTEEELRDEIVALEQGAQGRQFTAEERERWNSLNEKVEEYETRRQRILELAQNPANRDGSRLGHRTAPTPHSEQTAIRDQALRANERSSYLPDECRAHMERTLRKDDDPEQRLSRITMALADRSYLDAFIKWFNQPDTGPHTWTPQEREAVERVQYLERAMGLGTGGGGGFLAAYELDPSILIASTGSVDPMRAVARVDTTAWNEKRYVTSVGAAASWDAEATEVSDDSPPLLQPTIVCKKAQTFVPISFELAADTDIIRELQRVFQDYKLQLEATAFTVGTGSATEPKGIITAVAAVPGSVIVVAAGSALVNTDVYANQNALPPRWRPNAQWMANLSIINEARRLLKAAGLTESLVDDSGDTPKMLGWNLRENSSMDGVFGAGNDYVLLSGDFRQYAILDRIGTTFSQIPHLAGAAFRPTAQTGVHMYWRVGADALIADAFRLTNYSV